MFDRTGRRAGDLGGDLRRAARRNNYAGGARARRRAGHSAQVARVGDLIETGEKRSLRGRQLVGVGVAVGLDPGHDPLVLARLRLL